MVLTATTLPADPPAGKAPAPPTSKPAAAAAPPTAAAVVRQAVAKALDQLENGASPASVEKSLFDIFDRVIVFTPENQPEPFIETAHALRLVRFAAQGSPEQVRDRIAFLRKNPGLSRTLAFLINDAIAAGGQQESPGSVRRPYEVLDQLRAAYADRLDKFSDLTAAVCVVHDRALQRSINENPTEAAQPDLIWRYFADNEARMVFGIRGVPAELLCYVVDTTTPLREMAWALDKYHGYDQVGRLFFVVRYDYNYLASGKQKAVTVAGFSLPNILKFGGVCADQAYFATAVGKAIGVPTAYTTGSSAEVSHAWVGFLQARGKQAAWNFDIGRYSAYQGVRGLISDPQTRKTIPDGCVSVLALLVGTKPVERQAAIAFSDAAARVAQLRAANRPLSPEPLVAPAAGEPGKPPAKQLRTSDVTSQLDLLEASVKACPGEPKAWFSVAQLAASGAMSWEDKVRWTDALLKLIGDRYPDFTMTIMAPMIASVADVNRQNALWEKAFSLVQRQRADLAAEVRMAQGKMWENAKDVKAAGRCYEDVIERYVNAGPFVIEALKRTEKALRESGMGDKAPSLYARAFSRASLPGDMAPEFQRQSNWYRIGMMYVDRLEAAGQTAAAASVRNKIEQTIPTANVR